MLDLVGRRACRRTDLPRPGSDLIPRSGPSAFDQAADEARKQVMCRRPLADRRSTQRRLARNSTTASMPPPAQTRPAI